MKRALLIAAILFASVLSADERRNGLYRGLADALYCKLETTACEVRGTTITFETGGTDRIVINGSGALNCSTDGGCDIGNGLADFRDLSLKRNLILRGSTSGKVTFAAAATTTDYTFTWPSAVAGTPSTMFLRGDGSWAVAGASCTALTAGDLTVTNDGSNCGVFVATFGAADVAGAGAVNTYDLKAATLPAKAVVTNVFLVVRALENSLSSHTVSLGRTAASYVDYIAAVDMTSGGTNNIRGNAAAERGTNNTGYDFPSWTATTDVRIRFDAGAEFVGDSGGFAGTVIIEYYVIP